MRGSNVRCGSKMVVIGGQNTGFDGKGNLRALGDVHYLDLAVAG